MLGPHQSLPTLCKLQQQHMHYSCKVVKTKFSRIFGSLSLLLKSQASLWSSPHTTLNTLLRNSSAMDFHSMLVQLTWVGVILSFMAAAATATAFPLALPNCTDRCGDVKIPYPFGITEGCFLNGTRDFFINCSNSSGQPQPLTGNLKVTNISIWGQIEILIFKAEDCYNYTNGRSWNKTTADLQIPSFTISVIENKFVTVGCDT